MTLNRSWLFFSAAHFRGLTRDKQRFAWAYEASSGGFEDGFKALIKNNYKYSLLITGGYE